MGTPSRDDYALIERIRGDRPGAREAALEAFSADPEAGMMAVITIAREAPDHRDLQRTLAELALAHAEVGDLLRDRFTFAFLPDGVKRALYEPAAALEAMSVPLPAPIRTERDEGEELPARLDWTARDLRRVLPADLDALLEAWLARSVAALARALEARGHGDAAAPIRRAHAAVGAGRDWVASVWTAARDAPATPLDPASELLVRGLANALHDVVAGHFDGDYGADGATGHVALAQWLPRAVACIDPTVAPTEAWDAPTAAHLTAELEAAQARW